MTTVEHQRGTISIDDQAVNIEGSSLEALRIWYRDRKSTVVLISLCIILVAVMGILDAGPLTRPLIAGFLVAVGVMVAEFLLKYFGLIENRSTIPRDSIEKITYSRMGRIRPSNLVIHYSNSSGETHTRKLRLANPIMSSGDRVDQAIEAFREHNIDVANHSG